MTRFENKTNSVSVTNAIIKAEKLLQVNSKMITEIKNKNDFKYDSGNGNFVASKLLEPCHIIPVKYYRPFNRWSSAVGYSDGTSVYINSRKTLSDVDLIGLLLHEYSHACNGKFHHGNNYKTFEKCLYSVPYFISENITKWI